MNQQVRIVIAGLVQGVNFRTEAKVVADQLGLTGYARNLPDGRVEILAEGDEGRLGELIDWTRVGPERARVASVRTRFSLPSNAYQTFEAVSSRKSFDSLPDLS